jgi:hypothetical protein
VEQLKDGGIDLPQILSDTFKYYGDFFTNIPPTEVLFLNLPTGSSEIINLASQNRISATMEDLFFIRPSAEEYMKRHQYVSKMYFSDEKKWGEVY